jgi:amino acid transporter
VSPRRRLTLLDVLCIGVNSIVGSGIFLLPDDIQRAMGPWSPAAYVACALLLMPVALCFAELGAKYEESGGVYVYARDAFGRGVGFLVGWVCWVSTFVSWGANTRGFVEVVGVEGEVARRFLVAGIILFLGAVNYVGVKLGAWLVNVLTFAKLAAILLFVAGASTSIDPARFGGAVPRGAVGLGQGIFLAVFPLQGFEVVPIPAGETHNPKRNVPIATVGSLLLSALLFVVVQACLVGSYPHLELESPNEERGLRGPLVDAAWSIAPLLGLVVLIGGMVSMGGFLAGNALGAPRYVQALSADGFLPRSLNAFHARFDTPHVAIVVTTALTAAVAVVYEYRELVGMASLTVLVQYLATCIAVPVLRRRRPAATRTWVVPGGPVLPLLGAAGSLVLILNSAPAEVEFAAWALVAGALVALLRRYSAVRK